MILLTLIGWLIERIQERQWDKERAKWSAPPAPSNPGCKISDAQWNRAKGVNPTGKYNDIW